VPHVRITASSTDASTPLFIGIGRTSAVNDYLAGAPHDQISDIETDPFSVSYQTTAGSRQPAAPGAQTSSWVARATGAGSQTLTWPVESGQWSVLAMNADGSQSVSLDAKLAAVPFLRWLTVGLFSAGGLLIIGSSALLYFALRRRPTH
jgi:hypothetical protein